MKAPTMYGKCETFNAMKQIIRKTNKENFFNRKQMEIIVSF